MFYTKKKFSRTFGQVQFVQPVLMKHIKWHKMIFYARRTRLDLSVLKYDTPRGPAISICEGFFPYNLPNLLPLNALPWTDRQILQKIWYKGPVNMSTSLILYHKPNSRNFFKCVCSFCVCAPFVPLFSNLDLDFWICLYTFHPKESMK